jgi:serine protease Do
MSVRSLNWLKFGGLVGFAFVLGLLFAGLLNLPKSSLAQGGGTRLTSSQSPIKPVEAPPLPAARPLAELSDAFSAVAEHVRPSVVFIKSERKERVAQMPQIPRGFEPFFNFPRQQQGRGSSAVPARASSCPRTVTSSTITTSWMAPRRSPQLLDRRSFPAKVIGTDANTDVAVIKIEACGAWAAALGSSSATRSASGCSR